MPAGLFESRPDFILCFLRIRTLDMISATLIFLLLRQICGVQIVAEPCPRVFVASSLAFFFAGRSSYSTIASM